MASVLTLITGMHGVTHVMDALPVLGCSVWTALTKARRCMTPWIFVLGQNVSLHV